MERTPPSRTSSKRSNRQAVSSISWLLRVENTQQDPDLQRQRHPFGSTCCAATTGSCNGKPPETQFYCSGRRPPPDYVPEKPVVLLSWFDEPDYC